MVNGKRVVVLDEPIVKKKSKKCNCPVMIYAQVNKEGVWKIKKVVNEHKFHTPTPGKSRHIPMYKKENLTKHLERKIENDHGAGAPIGQIFNVMASERHGVENVGFTKKDIHNLVNRKRRLKLKNGDASAMLDYFSRMTGDNQNFYHMHRLDESGKLKDVMWVDARSRAAYQYFGDVVCFDSTYLTNQYELPFSNFVGVNHHGQSILLGCALVSHENSETFEWLFKTWVACMGGKPPTAIMTDQDAAMRKAINAVLPMPETRHRWCMWHIMKKFGQKLGSLSNYEQVKEVLQHVIYNSITPEEFMESWWEAVKRFELEQKECYEWLEGLYEQREMWIPAYVKGVFWAGMQTTQRVESINSFFDGYLNKHTRLCEFAPRYCKAMESRANDEKEADANSSRFVRPLSTDFALERKFHKVYTDAKFVEIQIQLNRVMYLTPISKRSVSENEEEHVFSDRVSIYSKFLKRKIPLTGRVKEYTVLYNKERKSAFCDCRHFECHGIVCRHIIKVLDMNNITEVPSMYILNRWRKDVKRKHTLVKVAYHDPSKTDEVRRYDKLMLGLEPVVMRASTSDEAIEILTDLIQLMSLRIDELGVSNVGPSSVGTARPSVEVGNPQNVPSTSCSVNKVSPAEPQNTPSTTDVKDPEPKGKNKKGRPRGSRFLSADEPAKGGKSSGRKKQAKGKVNAIDLVNESSQCIILSEGVGCRLPLDLAISGGIQRTIVQRQPNRNTGSDMFLASSQHFTPSQLEQVYFSGVPNENGTPLSYEGQMLVGGIHLTERNDPPRYFTSNALQGQTHYGDPKLQSAGTSRASTFVVPHFGLNQFPPNFYNMGGEP